MTLNYGTVYVNSDFYLAAESVTPDTVFENNINNYPVDTTMGFTLGVSKRVLKLTNVRCKTVGDAESVHSKILALQKALTPFKIEWAIAVTPTYFKFDGTTASMKVLCEKITGVEQAQGFQTLFIIKSIVFKEAMKP